MLFEEQARAKVNLTLKVLGRRADGFHDLESVVAFAAVGDRITLDTSRPIAVEIAGAYAPQLPSEYLIARTLDALAAAAPSLRLGAVRLEKNLPVAAGIGGGSADAAAVLRAAQRANPDVELDLFGIAAGLGADVPVCLANAVTFMTGRGDQLHPMQPLPRPMTAVLVNPRVAVPADKTAQVFRALRAGPIPGAGATSTAPRFASAEEVVSAIRQTGNDLEPAARAVMPVVDEVLSVLHGLNGCLAAGMSGAGPTCFAIVKDAQSAAGDLRRSHPGWWIEPTTLS